MRKWRIGLVGIRGLPPNYGGYETLSGKLGPYLVDRGNRVLVSCERPEKRGDSPKDYKGAELVYFPFRPPRNYRLRKLYEGLNDLYFYFRIGFRVDVLYVMAGIGTQALGILRILRPGLKIVTNNDGVEWERAKYGKIERLLIKSFIRSSLRFSHIVIHDHPKLEARFPKHNSTKTTLIEYGADIPELIEWSSEVVREYGRGMSEISPEEYYILVARLQRDNNIHLIMDGFNKSNTVKKLVIVGNFTDSEYEKELRPMIEESGGKILLPGGIYDRYALDMLRQHAFSAFHGHSAGGTNPALLEAMAIPMNVIAHRNEFNQHVLDENGEDMFNDSKELAEIINRLENKPEVIALKKTRNKDRIIEQYSWKECLEKHESVLGKRD